MTGPVLTEALDAARALILQSLTIGAPGLSGCSRDAVVRSIMLKLEGKVLAPLLAALQQQAASIGSLEESVNGLEAAHQQVTAERDEAQEKIERLSCADETGAVWRPVPGWTYFGVCRQISTATSELARLRAEGEAKDRALKEERARRKAAVQSVREKAAALCDEAAAYFDRTTGHYDRSQAAGGYRATASKIRLLTPDRSALARAATAREG
ncbi:hypothetical protein [Methylorubrum populi]|uniref:Uncharacterized protein n=1 Tax=Methylorubrum populi TaxID=223967 RepID=A0A833J3M2_9HYPH|nr:hypothetical protein [Methylorubrum populi]KAB7784058.1 hypothetical protein F8B43_3981 [Methylorubrum populi]